MGGGGGWWRVSIRQSTGCGPVVGGAGGGVGGGWGRRRSGGVGVATTRVAGVMGLTVIAMSRSAEKGKKLEEIGAAIVVNPEDVEWVRKLKERLGARRVDLAIDNIGGALF